MRVTLKDIAKEAGVSAALVSYCLNGSKSGWMSEETRKRIEEAAKKLDYRPNRLARSLRTGKTRSIGMLVGNISDSYFGHLAEEVLEAARKRDYSLVLAVSKHENEERENALEFLMRNQIDALLTCSSVVNLPEAKNLKKNGIPVVRFGYPEPDAISLQDNVESALKDACRYLKERGHRSMFCFFDTPLPWNSLIAGIADEVGIELVHRTFNSFREAHEIFQWIENNRPSAILMNGRILYQLLERIRGIPDYFPEIIRGVDEFYHQWETPLVAGGILSNTTLKARRAVEILIERLENPDLSREGIILLPPSRFISYESVQ